MVKSSTTACAQKSLLALRGRNHRTSKLQGLGFRAWGLGFEIWITLNPKTLNPYLLKPQLKDCSEPRGNDWTTPSAKKLALTTLNPKP